MMSFGAFERIAAGAGKTLPPSHATGGKRGQD